MITARDAEAEYQIKLVDKARLTDLHALILAVPHEGYRQEGAGGLCVRLTEGGILIDVKSALDVHDIPETIPYWSL